MLNLLGGGIYHYDGGDNPKDVRHRVMRCAERMYRREAGPPLTATTTVDARTDR